MLFAQPEPLTLYATDTAEPEYSEDVEEGLVTQMTALRDHLFHLLHDRTVPINLRLCQVLIEAQEAQWIWEEERDVYKRQAHGRRRREDLQPGFRRDRRRPHHRHRHRVRGGAGTL